MKLNDSKLSTLILFIILLVGFGYGQLNIIDSIRLLSPDTYGSPNCTLRYMVSVISSQKLLTNSTVVTIDGSVVNSPNINVGISSQKTYDSNWTSIVYVAWDVPPGFHTADTKINSVSAPQLLYTCVPAPTQNITITALSNQLSHFGLTNGLGFFYFRLDGLKMNMEGSYCSGGQFVQCQSQIVTNAKSKYYGLVSPVIVQATLTLGNILTSYPGEPSPLNQIIFKFDNTTTYPMSLFSSNVVGPSQGTLVSFRPDPTKYILYGDKMSMLYYVPGFQCLDAYQLQPTLIGFHSSFTFAVTYPAFTNATGTFYLVRGNAPSSEFVDITFASFGKNITQLDRDLYDLILYPPMTIYTFENVDCQLVSSTVYSFQISATTDYPLFLTSSPFTTTASLPYPWGYYTGNATLFQFKTSIIVPPYSRSLDFLVLNYKSNPSSNLYVASPGVVTDVLAPLITSLRLIRVNIMIVEVQVAFKDDLSGVFNVLIGGANLTRLDLVMGDFRDGVFSKALSLFDISSPSYSTSINDLAGNYFSLPYNMTFNEAAPLDTFGFTPDQITHMKFVKNSIVNNRQQYTLELGIGIINPSSYQFCFIPLTNDKLAGEAKLEDCYNGNYDSNSGYFLFEFDLPTRLPPQKIDYIIPIDLGYNWDSVLLNEYLGVDALLIIPPQTQFDMFPPQVVSINTYQPFPIVASHNTTIQNVGWTIRIQDTVNGLAKGYLQYNSNYDLQPRVIPFQPSSTQNDKDCTFNLLFSIPPTNMTRTLQIYISDIVLTDKLGYSSGMFDSKISSTLLLPTPLIIPNITVVPNTFAQSDDVGPIIEQVNMPFEYVDIGSASDYDRTVHITFRVTDTGSGVLVSSTPICYVEGFPLGTYLQQPATIVNIVSTQSIDYKCEMVIPFGFGIGGGDLAFSIYGAMDNNYNLGAGLASELNLYVSIPSQVSPRLISYLYLPSLDTLLLFTNTLYPNNPDLGLMVANTSNGLYTNYNYSKNASNTRIIVSGIPLITKPFWIKIRTPGYDTNSILIEPPGLYYEPDQSLCFGTPLCGGASNGICTDTGCVCNAPWFGVDCLSQVVINPPAINNTSPEIITNNTINTGGGSGNNNTNTYTQIETVLSIVSIRELDINGKTVDEFRFTNWTFTNRTDISDVNTNYFYNTTIDSTPPTTVMVTVQYFSVATNIQFATTTIHMQPSSIKFSVELTSYPFKQHLNTLQVIFQTSIEDKKYIPDPCKASSSTNGIGNMFHWFKLQVGKLSLYSKFIEYGIIDNRVVSLPSASIITDYSTSGTRTGSSSVDSSTQSAYLALNVPHFTTGAIMDPDFSLIIDFTDNDQENICGNSDDTNKKKSTIIAIAVAIPVVVLSVVGAVTFYYIKKRKLIFQKKRMESRLNKLNT